VSFPFFLTLIFLIRECQVICFNPLGHSCLIPVFADDSARSHSSAAFSVSLLFSFASLATFFPSSSSPHFSYLFLQQSRGSVHLVFFLFCFYFTPGISFPSDDPFSLPRPRFSCCEVDSYDVYVILSCVLSSPFLAI